MNGTITPTTDRRLLAEVSRWRKANDWTNTWRGWTNARSEREGTLAVDFDPYASQVRVWRKAAPSDFWPIRSSDYAVDSVRRAVDLLVALDILPAHFSSAYKAGRDDALADDWDDYCDYGYPLGGGGRIPARIDWCGLKRGHGGLHYGGDRQEVGFTDRGTVRRGGTR